MSQIQSGEARAKPTALLASLCAFSAPNGMVRVAQPFGQQAQNQYLLGMRARIAIGHTSATLREVRRRPILAATFVLML